MDTSKILAMYMDIATAVVAYNTEYLKKHPLDWDACGFAYVQVRFGRKTKLKKELIEARLIDSDGYEHWSGKYHLFRIPLRFCPSVGHQSITYQEGRAKAAMEVIKQHIPAIADLIYVDSRMD